MKQLCLVVLLFLMGMTAELIINNKLSQPFDRSPNGETSMQARTLDVLMKELNVPPAHQEGHGIKVKDLVMTCGDFRFRDHYARWIDSELDGVADRHTWPGCTKGFTDPDTRADMLKVIGTYRRLHTVSVVHLFSHQDCGGHGGAYEHRTVLDEVHHHHSDLVEAASIITTKFPDVTVRIYYSGCVDLYTSDRPRMFRWTELTVESFSGSAANLD